MCSSREATIGSSFLFSASVFPSDREWVSSSVLFALCLFSLCHPWLSLLCRKLQKNTPGAGMAGSPQNIHSPAPLGINFVKIGVAEKGEGDCKEMPMDFRGLAQSLWPVEKPDRWERARELLGIAFRRGGLAMTARRVSLREAEFAVGGRFTVSEGEQSDEAIP